MKIVGKLVLLLTFTLLLCGCSISEGSTEKVADIDFTVVEEENLPQEIKNVIEEKKEDEFRVIFSAEENMYIAIGYGKRETSGYSIAVKDLYLTENSIRVKTSLLGPSKGETINEEPTYPYIVIMIENRDYPVVFD